MKTMMHTCAILHAGIIVLESTLNQLSDDLQGLTYGVTGCLLFFPIQQPICFPLCQVTLLPRWLQILQQILRPCARSELDAPQGLLLARVQKSEVLVHVQTDKTWSELCIDWKSLIRDNVMIDDHNRIQSDYFYSFNQLCKNWRQLQSTHAWLPIWTCWQDIFQILISTWERQKKKKEWKWKSEMRKKTCNRWKRW